MITSQEQETVKAILNLLDQKITNVLVNSVLLMKMNIIY